MFPETFAASACFPNVSQFYHAGSIVFSVNFGLKEAKYVSAKQQKHSVFRAAWRHVPSFYQGLTEFSELAKDGANFRAYCLNVFTTNSYSFK